MIKFQRGEIWLMDLNPTLGSEINKVRPVIIVSRGDFNQFSKTLTVIPISSGHFIPGMHVSIQNLKPNSHAVIPQIRIGAKERLRKKIGSISEIELKEIGTQLAFYLDLYDPLPS